MAMLNNQMVFILGSQKMYFPMIGGWDVYCSHIHYPSFGKHEVASILVHPWTDAGSNYWCRFLVIFKDNPRSRVVTGLQAVHGF